MTSRDFCYWLQGFFEISQMGITTDSDGNKPEAYLTGEQISCVRNHLNMVFKHEIDPSHGDTAHQEELAKAHKGKPSPPQKSKNSGGGLGYQKPRAMG